MGSRSTSGPTFIVLAARSSKCCRASRRLRGARTAELLNKHLKAGPPSLQAVTRNASDEITQLLKRMMAKSPEARPRDCNAFLQEFRASKLFKAS